MITFPGAEAFELGFAPTAATLLSLGPQNAMLLRQGLSGREAWVAVCTCYGCDLGLVLFGTMGLGAVIATVPVVSLLLRAAGIGYLLLMSVRSFLSALREAHAGPDGTATCARRVFLAALLVSVFNPLAWVESVLVVGAISATVPSDLVIVVASGASLGTVFRLGVLRLGARVLRPMFRGRLFRRAFDTMAGLTMAAMAIVLMIKLVA